MFDKIVLKLEVRTISLQEIPGRIVEPVEVKAAFKTGVGIQIIWTLII